MIEAGKLRPVGYWQTATEDAGGNLDGYANIAIAPRVRAQKLTESASQRKAAAGLHGSDTITYRMRYRSDLTHDHIISADDARQLEVIGIENVGDLNRELLVTVRDRSPH